MTMCLVCLAYGFKMDTEDDDIRYMDSMMQVGTPFSCGKVSRQRWQLSRHFDKYLHAPQASQVCILILYKGDEIEVAKFTDFFYMDLHNKRQWVFQQRQGLQGCFCELSVKIAMWRSNFMFFWV